MQTKTCTKCGVEKSIDQFHKDSKGAHKVKSRCKICLSSYDKEFHKQYSIKNKEIISERKKLTYEKNKEKILIERKEYYTKNREMMLEKTREYVKRSGYGKKYYAENKEKLLQTHSDWVNSNKPRLQEYQRGYREERKEHYKELRTLWEMDNKELLRTYARKRRALKKQVNEHYTKDDEQYTRELFNHQCANCGTTDKLCIDHHYPLSKGYALTRENAVVLCNKCNLSKSDKNPEEFYSPDKLENIASKLSPVI